jgi:hypothetical protein
MKKLVLAAIAALSLNAGAAFAASVQHPSSASQSSYPIINLGGDGAAG